jgi:TIR domain
MNEESRHWNKLLQNIAKGQVITIVGRDLLRIAIDGREQLLYDYLASELAALTNVNCMPGTSLDDVVVSYLAADRKNERDDIYEYAFNIFNALRDAEGRFPVPDSLRKLASIEPLRLFVSTTADSLLASALGCPTDHIFAYAPNSEVTDIPRDYARSPNRIVFQLFGKLSGLPPDSALLEEETLEFIWNLHLESSKRLVNLFDELHSKRLLLIGNAQADWLARFFLRLARRERLSSGSDAREFLADFGEAHERGFFDNFCPQTRSFGARNPIEFVDQLAERWAAFPDKPAPARSGGSLAAPAVKPPAVFISYASQDRDAVERLRARLDGAGLDVWFDKARLGSGDPWWPVIEQNIVTCDVFLPIVSANSNQRDEGIFIREWNRALARLEDMDKITARFVHPIIVDSTPEIAVTFGGFREFHFTRAAGGEPAAEFVQRLVGLVRERRARRAARL